MISTTAKGNDFRDLIDRILSAAGFSGVKSEIRLDHKKVDVVGLWGRRTFDGALTFAIEAKDYSGTVDKDECIKFIYEYKPLIDNRTIDRAWLISKGPISPDGRRLIEQNRDIKCFTFSEFQRHLMGFDGYLLDIIKEYDNANIKEFYIPPFTEDNVDLEKLVNTWIVGSDSTPLAILAAYGKGKSTFALHLSAALAINAQNDSTQRIPILVRLGEIVNEQSLDGLIGKVLASKYEVANYHFHLFTELNEAGRFVIIFDGLDEMKHGMTIFMFEQTISSLLSLDKGSSRILFLGRDTALATDAEFRVVIEGIQTTGAGRQIASRTRRALKTASLRGFTLDEARSYVRRCFPLKAVNTGRRKSSPPNNQWVEDRINNLLSGDFDELIVRPVHAEMLCEIASDQSISLHGLTAFELYDSFIHYLLDREVSKAGRFPGFSVDVRRRFNSAVAWWLWEQNNASTTTLNDVPMQICHDTVGTVQHDFDTISLKRELIAGCLVEKAGTAVYFGHRSIQEFLVAEHIFKTDMLRGSDAETGRVSTMWPLLNDEITGFLLEFFNRAPDKERRAKRWLEDIDRWRVSGILPNGIALFSELLDIGRITDSEIWKSPSKMHFAFYQKLLRSLKENENIYDDQGAVSMARSFVENMNGKSYKVQAAIMRIWLEHAVRLDAKEIYTMIAYGMPIKYLRKIMDILESNPRSTHTLKADEQFVLAVLLHCGTISREERELYYDLNVRKLDRVTAGASGFSLDLQATPLLGRTAISIPIPDSVKVPISNIYSKLHGIGVKGSDIDVVRRFFNENSIRTRIKPVFVVENVSRALDSNEPRSKTKRTLPRGR